MNKLFTFIFAMTFMVSCDTGFHSAGLVINKATRQPIDSVKIYIKNIDSTYTDSLGHYKIDTMVYGYAGSLEILLAKDGYKTKHVNFKSDPISKDAAVIEMEKLEADSLEDLCIQKKVVPIMYYVNLYFISLLNLLTLLFLIFKKEIKRKIVWILSVLLFNCTLFVSITDCSIMDFSLINGPFYLTHYWLYPYSVKIVVPIATILFWCIYLIKRRIVFRTKE